MSFKQNDTNDNNMIHLGNYEEYFILYMDNELGDEQMKMVDDFLAEHPDLQGEFEMLMSTRLPMEELNINKNELLSEKMKLNTVDEELLLYIDNELPAEEKNVIELELENNKDYQLQLQLLMRSKLDASDRMIYPYKAELYKKEERKVVAFKPWMRIAAAVVVIAVSAALYFNNSTETTPDTDIAGTQDGRRTQDVVIKDNDQNTANPANKTGLPGDREQQDVASGSNESVPGKSNKLKLANDRPGDVKNDLKNDVKNDIAKVDQQDQQAINNQGDAQVKFTDRTPVIENKSITNVAVAAIKTPSEIINKNPVTSVLANRNTIVDAPANKIDETVASNKGSVKGFLRKTTRLIEKKTGIDPTNDGELLIGAVAINLN